MISTREIYERIYSGIVGKAIGVRLGGPIESPNWTLERTRSTFGEIDGYFQHFRNFAADDDTNGPIYFIRAMRDYGLEPTAEQVGKTWLNYAAEEHGMYWWGGYGVSTEHTAYRNLKAGIPAPRSGSIEQNGAAVAEQIGGQIFIDSWGWVNPGNPEKAAEMAARAASVSHDGNGIHGARWVTAAIARAFTATSVDEIVEAAMAAIPADSEYARVVQAVIDFHRAQPDDWYACRLMLERDFGYDRYPGVCHIIPNAGALITGVLYGKGDLNRTVEVAVMCAWDTDCNAGNAGAIIGTFQKVQPHWAKYREPINDFLIASGVATTLNITDIPTFARELTVLACQLGGETPPPVFVEDMTRRGVRFDFDLPGSTHGFRTEGTNYMRVKWSDERTNGAKGALLIEINNLLRAMGGRVFWKPFYRRGDFDDDRYKPMLTPVVSTGQMVSFDLYSEPWEGDGNIRVRPYVRRAMSGTIDEIGGWDRASHGEWKRYSFAIPDTGGEAIDEVGFTVEYDGRLRYIGRMFLANFAVEGAGRTLIDPKVETQEWGGITRFTWNRGHWTLQDGAIHAATSSDADAWTGHYYARDLTVKAEVRPLVGTSHLITARAQGTSRFYGAGFERGQLVIVKEDFGTTLLASVPFVPELGRNYELELTVEGRTLSLSVDRQPMLVAEDESFAYGMCGLRLGSAGRMSVGRLEIVEQAA